MYPLSPRLPPSLTIDLRLEIEGLALSKTINGSCINSLWRCLADGIGRNWMSIHCGWIILKIYKNDFKTEPATVVELYILNNEYNFTCCKMCVRHVVNQWQIFLVLMSWKELFFYKIKIEYQAWNIVIV